MRDYKVAVVWIWLAQWILGCSSNSTPGSEPKGMAGNGNATATSSSGAAGATTNRGGSPSGTNSAISSDIGNFPPTTTVAPSAGGTGGSSSSDHSQADAGKPAGAASSAGGVFGATQYQTITGTPASGAPTVGGAYSSTHYQTITGMPASGAPTVGGAFSATGGGVTGDRGGAGGTAKGSTATSSTTPTTGGKPNGTVQPSTAVGGAAGSSTATGSGLHVTFAAVRPGGVLLGNQESLLLACDSGNNVITVGPSVAHDLSKPDPGPRISLISPTGEELSQQDYPDAVSPEVLAVDSKSSRILAGQLYRNVSFGGTALESVENGYYLVKLDANGKELWARAIQTPDSFWLRDVAVDSSDDIYVAGSQSDMSEGWLEHASITKYSGATGASVWKQQFQNTNSTGTANGLAFYSNGAVAVAGAFNGKMQVGSERLVTAATSNGYESYNGWFARLNAQDGAPSGVQRFGGTIFDLANAVGVTSTDKLRLAGGLSGTSSIAGVSATAVEDGAPFVAEVDQNGKGQWIRLLGDKGSVFDAAIDSADRTIAVGRFDPEESTPGTLDASPAFVAVVGVDGSLSQLLTFMTRSNGAHAVATDRLGGVWVSGEFTGTTTFGSTELKATDFQLFLIRLSP